MFNPSRDEVRQFFFSAWQKRRDSQILTPLEMIATDWIVEHPEYHAMLEAPPSAAQQDFTPQEGQTNPFLHLAMHLSIAEQVSIDQPAGIRAAMEQLERRNDSTHQAHHEAMECLGEMLWRAQRDGTPPDGLTYVDCVRRRATSR